MVQFRKGFTVFLPLSQHPINFCILPPTILSLSDQFTKADADLAQSNIEQELKQEIASIKEDIAAGFDDPDNWLKALTYFKDHSDEIRHHLSVAVSNTVEWNDSFLVDFFKNIRLQLTEDILQKANTVIIRYSYIEIVHLDFHYINPAEPIVQQSGYDESIPGTEVSLYEIGKPSCRSAKIYNHPIVLLGKDGKLSRSWGGCFGDRGCAFKRSCLGRQFVAKEERSEDEKDDMGLHGVEV